ncbi:PE-PGRS family protein [Streptomyces albireticuli]|uniref:PE-PGRS family protein n=1 Tax=Streptomyces albireticuli TaxID=1940 RepID=UPI00369BA37F
MRPSHQHAIAVRRDHPGLTAELNAHWHRLASEHGLIGADGTFLINVAGSRRGPAACGWTRVQLAARWDLAEVLGERPGQPEFVTLSADGDTLLGMTTKEYEVWIVAVTELGRQREAAARAEGPGDPSGAGGGLGIVLPGAGVRGLPGVGAQKALVEKWAAGLAHNPAATEDVLKSLLGHSHYLPWRPDLPPSAVDAGLAHPEWRVRGLFAEARPTVTPEQWTRLVLAEQDPRQRWILATLAVDRREELTGSAYERLATDPAARTRAEAARLTALPTPLLAALAADPEPTVRASACRPAWPHLDRPARQRLLTDTAPEARTAAMLRHHAEHPLTRAAFEAEGLEASALQSCHLDRDFAHSLAHQGNVDQRRMLAGNPDLDPDITALLAHDPDDGVRYTVSLRPDLTEVQRADICLDFAPGALTFPLDWVVALHANPGAMRRLAASHHPVVRRSVARAEQLPEDVVALLAEDEDRVVQLFLAESCDDAPADMLLRVWRWWTGSLTHPDRPRSHPDFPRHGLLRYAGDPDPRMRRLALDDPSGAVRRTAVLHPHLPARVLIRLLRDVETAETAAANPSLLVGAMREMLQLLAA